jgi:hypothetical protein
MKIVILSDHTADVLRQQQQQRADFQKSRRDAYYQQVEAYKARKLATSAKLSKAWEARNLLQVISCLAQWIRVYMSASPVAPQQTGSAHTQREAIWTAGNEGEKLVSQCLARQLNDQWTLFKGYHNSKGEIDFVLVGPPGVFAIRSEAPQRSCQYLRRCLADRQV